MFVIRTVPIIFRGQVARFRMSKAFTKPKVKVEDFSGACMVPVQNLTQPNELDFQALRKMTSSPEKELQRVLDRQAFDWKYEKLMDHKLFDPWRTIKKYCSLKT